MPYYPHTPEDRRAMLALTGAASMDDLFRAIPEKDRLRRPLAIPAGKTEAEILDHFRKLEASNRRLDTGPSFLGAGCVRHYVPALVDYLASRGEFNTAYTPYQPEVSQGTLQAIFEYQSLLARLTGMEISNASLYDGATALAEAILMAYAVRGQGTKVLFSEGVHPEYRRVVDTYLRHHPVELEDIALSGGRTPPAEVERAIGEDTLALVIQMPNFLGSLEDVRAYSRLLASMDPARRPFFIAVVDPMSLGALIPPGAYGADVAVGDGQGLGNYPSYGGPSFGFFATRFAHVRKVPGRIVGETRDRDGRRGYVLTFQTREQHIRRERATSNICTNQGLLSLRGAMYLSLLGESGLAEVAESTTRKAHAAAARLASIEGVRMAESAPFFGEFPLEMPLDAEEVYVELRARGIVGGLPLGRYFPKRRREMLLAFSELSTMEDVGRLESALREILGRHPASTPSNEALRHAPPAAPGAIPRRQP